MKRKTLTLGILLFSFLFIVSCSSDDDTPDTDPIGQPDPDPDPDPDPEPDPINNPDQNVDTFVWSGMNAAYLYKANVPNLANDKFSTDEELFRFLEPYASPERLFVDLQASQDRFSFIVDDYIALEQGFSGVSKSNGMDFSLILASASSDDVLGYVRYVLPGTDADTKGITRGAFFGKVNGVQMTRNSDFNAIFSADSYTITTVTFDTATGEFTETAEISLTSVEYTENPILIAKTLDYQGLKIGYLMYNSFVGDFDPQLNDAFGQFKADGVTDLILDLRYNGGGLVRTAIDMGSMITGQFNGEIFSKEIWNAELQAQFSAGPDGEEALINRFRDKIFNDTPINSLGLTKLYVLTTDRTASASELIINSLEPYIDVVQIGGTTTGKFQASVTLYDGEGFARENASSLHTYAIQPLVLKSANKNDVTDYVDGLTPDVAFEESVLNLGVLGEVTEPFLKAALDHITGAPITAARSKNGFMTESINWETKALLPNYQRMYIGQLNFSPLAKREFK